MVAFITLITQIAAKCLYNKKQVKDMNKFLVFPCVEQSGEGEGGYKGPVVPFASTANVTFMLFFPIAKEYSYLINFLLKKEDSTKANMQLLAVYQTMVNSWKAGDRYLSGIVMDTKYDEDGEEDIITPTLIICDSSGNVDAVLNVNFVHAVMLGAMERKEILVTNELLNKLMPPTKDDDDESDEEEETEVPDRHKNKFPIDKDILDIAKNIMNGKNKGDSEGEDGEGGENGKEPSSDGEID